jgi:hypothetical protein
MKMYFKKKVKGNLMRVTIDEKIRVVYKYCYLLDAPEPKSIT